VRHIGTIRRPHLRPMCSMKESAECFSVISAAVLPISGADPKRLDL
jgi:hypothetical protein